MTSKIVTLKKSKVLFSDNKLFAVHREKGKKSRIVTPWYQPVVFVKPDHQVTPYLTVHEHFVTEHEQVQIGSEIYKALRFEPPYYENDCLKLAENIFVDQWKYGDSDAVMVDTNTKKLVGDTEKKNFQIAHQISQSTTAKKNENATPTPGQAYAILRTEAMSESVQKRHNSEGCPYHFANVVFQDGSTRITVEADRGDDRFDTMPIVRMYTTGSNPDPNPPSKLLTFHEAHTKIGDLWYKEELFEHNEPIDKELVDKFIVTTVVSGDNKQKEKRRKSYAKIDWQDKGTVKVDYWLNKLEKIKTPPSPKKQKPPTHRQKKPTTPFKSPPKKRPPVTKTGTTPFTRRVLSKEFQ